MMLCKTSRVAAALIAAMLSVVMLLTGSQAALAEPFHPRAAREHSRGYRTFYHGHERIYYHHGHFYRHDHHGFVATRPPAGLVIDALPALFTLVTVMGINYYHFEGVYYRHVPAGYQVVQPPPAPPAAPVVVQPAPTADGTTVVVEAPLLNVRRGPGRNFPVTTQIVQGTDLSVQGSAPGWYYVQLPGGKIGWVMSRFTQPLAAG